MNVLVHMSLVRSSGVGLGKQGQRERQRHRKRRSRESGESGVWIGWRVGSGEGRGDKRRGHRVIDKERLV